jgi:hypothetical protein
VLPRLTSALAHELDVVLSTVTFHAAGAPLVFAVLSDWAVVHGLSPSARLRTMTTVTDLLTHTPPVVGALTTVIDSLATDANVTQLWRLTQELRLLYEYPDAALHDELAWDAALLWTVEEARVIVGI